MSAESRKTNFLALLTFAVVTVYTVAAAWAMVANGLGFADFSAAIGPMAGMLLGYWVRGESGAPPS